MRKAVIMFSIKAQGKNIGIGLSTGIAQTLSPIRNYQGRS